MMSSVAESAPDVGETRFVALVLTPECPPVSESDARPKHYFRKVDGSWLCDCGTRRTA